MDGKYAGKWAEYRRICKFAVISLVGVVGVPFLSFLILVLLLQLTRLQLPWSLAQLPFLLGSACLFLAVYFGRRQYTWECPRCGRRFGRLHEECQNCALPKWANDDSDLRERKIAPGTEWPLPRI
jgi:hypothetical protein